MHDDKWAVYQVTKIKRGQLIDRDSMILISVHDICRDAMDAADKCSAEDRAHSYVVGSA